MLSLELAGRRMRRACQHAALARAVTIMYIESDDDCARSRSPPRLCQTVNVSSGDEYEQVVPVPDSDSPGPDDEDDDDSDSRGNLKIFKFHFMEIFSPVRVARHIWGMNLSSCGSFDIIDGVDFRSWSDRAQIRAIQAKHRPLFLMSSPPCSQS